MIAEIATSAQDLGARQVYADWLEERGDLRGQFLRLQVRLSQSGHDGSAQAAIRKQMRNMARRIDRDWLVRLDLAPVENRPCGETRRGGVEFEYQCPMQWGQLTPTADDTVRQCGKCEEYVFYCRSVREANTLTQFGACVAIDSAVLREANDLDTGIRIPRGIAAIPKRLQDYAFTWAKVFQRRRRR